MVFDGSYQTYFDDNRGAVAWGTHFIDTDRYKWGSLTTTSQVENAYISELKVLYEML